MTQYLLSVHHPVDFEMPDEDTMLRQFAQVDAFNARVQEQGSWVFAGGLTGVDDATVVDASAAQPVMTDGPFIEAKEYLGGFWVIEAADLDAALAIAAEASEACEKPVEVRPFQGEE